MALHGLIEVNRRPIGEWSALRIEGEEDGWCTYQCEVVMFGNDRPERVEPVRFRLRHHYNSGALWLARQVLGRADAIMERQQLDAERAEAGEQG